MVEADGATTACRSGSSTPPSWRRSPRLPQPKVSQVLKILARAGLLQIALLAGLGLWAGAMYVVLRAWLPFESSRARAAFFAFGVFGHCWTWFHLFIPVIEFTGILHLGFSSASWVLLGLRRRARLRVAGPCRPSG